MCSCWVIGAYNIQNVGLALLMSIHILFDILPGHVHLPQAPKDRRNIRCAEDMTDATGRHAVDITDIIAVKLGEILTWWKHCMIQ